MHASGGAYLRQAYTMHVCGMMDATAPPTHLVINLTSLSIALNHTLRAHMRAHTDASGSKPSEK